MRANEDFLLMCDMSSNYFRYILVEFGLISTQKLSRSKLNGSNLPEFHFTYYILIMKT